MQIDFTWIQSNQLTTVQDKASQSSEIPLHLSLMERTPRQHSDIDKDKRGKENSVTALLMVVSHVSDS